MAADGYIAGKSQRTARVHAAVLRCVARRNKPEDLSPGADPPTWIGA